MIPRLRARGGERSPVKERMRARRKIIFEMSGIDRRKSIRGSAAGASKRLFKFRQIAQSETRALLRGFSQPEAAARGERSFILRNFRSLRNIWRRFHRGIGSRRRFRRRARSRSLRRLRWRKRGGWRFVKLRDDFFRGRFADGAHGIPDAALRQSILATAGAVVGVEPAQGDLFLPEGEFREVDAGKLGGRSEERRVGKSVELGGCRSHV